MDEKIGANTLATTWKAALHESCFRSREPLKAIAGHLGIHPNTLGRACDEAQADNLSSKHLAALAQVADNHAFLDYLEARAGRVAYTLPQAGTLCSVQTVASIREFSEFAIAVTDGAQDGRMTRAEVDRITTEGLEAIRAIHEVIAAAQRQVPPLTEGRAA
jgi:transposase-like protein